jgi:hypothetical protein
MVMLLDAAMRLAISAQAGPKPRLEVPGRRSRRGIGWLTVGGAGALLAVAGAAVVIVALLKGPAGLSALGPHAPARTPVASAPASPSMTASPSASPSTRATASPSSPAPGSKAARPTAAPPPAVPLTARYAAADGGIGLLGYTAGVTIANPGPARRDGWRITLTLPRPTLQIAEVSGAVASQDGATWTFEPDKSTRSVPAGGSVQISFQVRGATLLTAAPRECQIDDRPCAGVGASSASSG